jgi:hypothetical protein
MHRADVLAELERFCRPASITLCLARWRLWTGCDGDIFTRIIISGRSGVDRYAAQKDEMAEGAFFPAAITENGLSRHVLILRMK